MVRFTEGKKIQVIPQFIAEAQDARRNRLYYPIVRFTLEDGTWITEKYSDGSNSAFAFLIIYNKSEHFDKFFK